MDKPEKILVSKDEVTLEQIDQRYIRVDHMSRYPILMELIKEQRIRKAIIFTKTRRGAYRLAKKLKREGLKANALHGDLSQSQRDRITQSFRRNRIDFLVATDIASRGLDIDDITHIINFNIPQETTVYFHRIGRTARMKNEGTAITFVAHNEYDSLEEIMDHTSTKINEMKTSIHVKKGPPQKYKAVCSKCSKKFELPFKPTQGRAVYCRLCFRSSGLYNHRRRAQ
jgi:CxxC-x17-CxxC domain-containing protein